jgi:predicted enzyme related to lactoylglutathione lyase
MQAKLTYAIKYVADMDKAVAFHRDVLGLTLRFQSPQWTEFDTGETTLALHEASDKNPAGHVQLGFGVDGLEAIHAERDRIGLTFTDPPTSQHGVTIARALDSEGAEISLSGN